MESAEHPLNAAQVQEVFVARFGMRPTIATVRTWLSRLAGCGRILRAATGRYASLRWRPAPDPAVEPETDDARRAAYRRWLVEWFISCPSIEAHSSAGLKALYRRDAKTRIVDRLLFNQVLEELEAEHFLMATTTRYSGGVRKHYLLSMQAHSIFR